MGDLEVVEEEGEDEEGSALPTPTPQSVAQDFQLTFPSEKDPQLPTLYSSHDTDGPVHRHTRAMQLSDHAFERQNKLGNMIHRKLGSLQDTIRDEQIHIDL